MSNSPSKGTDHLASTGFSLDRSTPSLWRVTFDNPPINLIDPAMIVALHDLLAEIEQDNRVAVVVFDSADADFFLAHYDIAADQSAFNALPAARTPFHHWANLLIRLSRSRAVTISALRGRARGAGSEFVLATDIRFAGRAPGMLARGFKRFRGRVRRQRIRHDVFALELRPAHLSPLAPARASSSSSAH